MDGAGRRNAAGRSWRWPIWLALSGLLLAVPFAVWMGRAWWPGWAAIVGEIDWLCEVPPDIAAREAEGLAAHDEERALRRTLAEIEERVLQRRAECRLPPLVAQAPPPPPPPPPAPEPQPAPPAPDPPPAPPPRSDFPEDRWNARDVSLLEGCWVLGRPTPARLHRSDGQTIEGTQRAGEYCFGANGRGTGTAVADFPGEHVNCRAPITSRFRPDGRLEIRRPRVTCNPPSVTWGTRESNGTDCRRISDSELACVGDEGIEQIFRRREPR